ncbi:hypothetical protein V2J09_024068 [Rumex salicifolius]
MTSKFHLQLLASLHFSKEGGKKTESSTVVRKLGPRRAVIAMATLSRLFNELRERIEASSSSPSNKADGIALETRFRAVLRNLLQAYVIPSSKANEREVIALLKLLNYVAKNSPGVFYHGKAGAILPLIGRILPFFAEPAFHARHGVIFETVGSLLTLLRTGERDVYRQFFMDAMVTVEDLLYIALSSPGQLGTNESSQVSLNCFSLSFAGVSSDTTILCELPDCNKSSKGCGIMVDLSGKFRWQPFSTWIVRILCKCLTEGTLYVEGLVGSCSVLAACSLLCYGDAELHMACFDFARIVGTVLNFDIIPCEKLIQSISVILNKNAEKVPTFRNADYDSSIGSCLDILHSSCSIDIVKATAEELVSAFHTSVLRTESPYLKDALCRAYIRIVETCPSNIWRPESLFSLIRSSESCLILQDCFEAVLSILGADSVEGPVKNNSTCQSAIDRRVQSLRAGDKRPPEDHGISKVKHQKIDGEFTSTYIDDQNICGVSAEHSSEINKQYSYHVRKALLSFLNLLKPQRVCDTALKAEVAFEALSMLCIACSKHPILDVSLIIFRQMSLWIPWMCEQANGACSVKLNLSICLQAIRSILLLPSPYLEKVQSFAPDGDNAAGIYSLLKLPWTHSLEFTQTDHKWRIKCLSIEVLCMLGPSSELQLEVLYLGLCDEEDDVRAHAVSSLPFIVLSSSFHALPCVFARLESLGKEKCEKVKKAVPRTIGYLSCLYGQLNNFSGSCENQCRVFLKKAKKDDDRTNSFQFQGFWCSRCDKVDEKFDHLPFVMLRPPDAECLPFVATSDVSQLLSLFFKLLYDESSDDIQFSCVRVLRRIMSHLTSGMPVTTRSECNKCVELSLVHRKRAVREAFCSQVRFFLQKPILDCLFSDEDTTCKEMEFLDKIKHGIAATVDPEIIETLLESVAEIMMAVDVHGQIFLHSLILLVDQLDSPRLLVRVTAARSLHRSCYFHLRGGFELILAKVAHARNKLFDYLCLSLPSRPKMAKEFAEAVLGIETEELVLKMIPIVLPKLVASDKDDGKSVAILQEMAKSVNTDMVQLIMNWLPKVLAFALHHADGRALLSALQFYHTLTSSDKQEIFSVALPGLLEELVCFMDDSDPDETNKRLESVPQVILEVARILNGGEDLPGFLRNHFVGLLNSIDRKMLHTEDISRQKQAIKRIELLITMMGSHLSTYVPKVMVLLMHAIGIDSLRNDALSALHFFIKNLVDLSASSAKHAFAALITTLEKEKDNPSLHLEKIVNMLEKLVCENKVVLKQHISEFPLLPSIPALTKVNEVIQEARGSLSLKDQLRDAAEGLNHENLNVRYMVACELSKLLNSRKADVAAVISEEADSSENALSSLITALLRGCAEESRTSVGQRLKMVCADCLGAVGAVDPAKIKLVSCQRFKIQCSDDDLIFELIHKHLARAFRAAPDIVVQDSAALAIQELLKIAGCEASLDDNATASISHVRRGKELVKTPASGTSNLISCDVMSGRGQRLWDRFSSYVKEMIAPCLTSRYQFPNIADSTSSGPIYSASMSFRRWVFLWIKKLIVHASGSRACILNACRGIVRHDMQTATYLLPYLVLDALCHGTEEGRQGITEEILSVLKAAASEKSGTTISGIAGGQNEVCMQAIFTLLDNLGQWVDDVQQEVALSHSVQLSTSRQQYKLDNKTANSTTEQLLAQCRYVSQLLFAISNVTLARASFRCQAYARSLMYFESHVRGKSGSFNPAAERSGVFEDEDVSFLMEIYSRLDESDALSGLASLRRSVSLQDQLLISKKGGNWAEALTCCEQALQIEPTSVQRHSDVLNCLLNMSHLQAMVTQVDGLISRIPEYRKTWSMQGVQAAWRLGRWDLMDEYLMGADRESLLCSSLESNASFDLDVAKILQAMIKKDQYLVDERIALSKQALIEPLAAAGMDSYARAYPFVLKLHLLKELEDFHTLLAGESFLEKSFHLGDSIFSKAVQNWECRLHFTQPSIWAREPLLAFRRLVFSASRLGALVGNCWLQYAKLCRSAGHYETANQAILEAQSSGAANVHMEKAKLLWGMRRSDGAIAELQQYLLSMPVEVVGSAAVSSITSLVLVPLNLPMLNCDTQTSNENIDIAKTLLLYTRWIHYTGQKQKEDVMSLYARVRELQPKWDKGYFYVAKYCDEVLVDARKRQEESTDLGPRMSKSGKLVSNQNPEKCWWIYLPEVLLFYAKGLHRGHRNLYQALRRLLTLWFDFGSVYQTCGGSSNKDFKTIHGKVMSIMRGCLKDLPTYQWLTVLPQLVSRICHQNEEIVRLVKLIITTVLRQYPQQALWLMVAVTKSTVATRREAAAEIIQTARRGSSQVNGCGALISQFTALVDHMIKLCFHPGQPKAKTINISTEFSALKRMMPLGIIMPTQQSLTISLPTCDINSSNSTSSNIFAHTDLPTIAGISDEAEILSSLQKPKKVILLGSDGIERPFLCKPKDDLRKDARMMEFNAMINRLLSKCPESRRRKLYIRTFAVLPLTEDCGMVEWVPHTRGLRHILQDIYITCGKFDKQKTNPQIKRIYDQCQGKMPEDEMLKTKILPMFPPVFHKWFLNTFSEPAAWFRARIAYAHTTAVWSMVGHIVGLGDRHGENILFDSTTGDCVHVDFSCLFDKGLQLEKPELVPFRLTQNMIDGLGITGYEGIYLRVCEITLSVLRSHKEPLMSVLETFIHDPLVEWTKSHKSSGVEVQNPHAQRAISNIEARLQGVVVGVAAAPSLPLAVEGQARRLITEAVSHKNLGKMYIWWMPWF